MSDPNFRGALRAIAFSLVALSALPAHAQPYTTVQTPPASAIASISSEDTLSQLALANLVASNCADHGLTKGDAGLLAATAQAVAEHLGVSTETYFSGYIHSAMAEIAGSDGCGQHADAARSLAEKVKELGGAVLGE